MATTETTANTTTASLEEPAVPCYLTPIRPPRSQLRLSLKQASASIPSLLHAESPITPQAPATPSSILSMSATAGVTRPTSAVLRSGRSRRKPVPSAFLDDDAEVGSTPATPSFQGQGLAATTPVDVQSSESNVDAEGTTDWGRGSMDTMVEPERRRSSKSMSMSIADTHEATTPQRARASTQSCFRHPAAQQYILPVDPPHCGDVRPPPPARRSSLPSSRNSDHAFSYEIPSVNSSTSGFDCACDSAYPSASASASASALASTSTPILPRYSIIYDLDRARTHSRSTSKGTLPLYRRARARTASSTWFEDQKEVVLEDKAKSYWNCFPLSACFGRREKKDEHGYPLSAFVPIPMSKAASTMSTTATLNEGLPQAGMASKSGGT